MNYIFGIDEAGRGPLAGPVAVGICKVSEDFDFTIFPNLKDSKKLSEKKREEFFCKMQSLKKEGVLDFGVALVSSNTIDKSGIVFAIKSGIKGLLEKLSVSFENKVFLDGGLVVPEEFKHQETIIKGDELIPVISLASIVAKVTRDIYMKEKAKDFPEYGFEIHKGYGTKKHTDAIRKHGLSTLHRKSFCKNFLE